MGDINPTLPAQSNPLRHSLNKTFSDVASCPAFLLSAGNVLLAASTGNPLGVAIQAGATATIGVLAARASLQNKPLDLPFYALGLSCLATAGFGIGGGLIEHGTKLVTEWSILLGNAALAGWGTGHLCTAKEIKSGEKPKSPIAYNMNWYGGADISAVLANPTATSPVAAGLAIAGFAKSLFSRNASSDHGPREGSIRWHVTPARLYGTGYIVNGIVAGLANPLFAAASITWGVGVWNFDRDQNKALRQNIVSVIRHKYESVKRLTM